jgi:hypothetical protein
MHLGIFCWLQNQAHNLSHQDFLVLILSLFSRVHWRVVTTHFIAPRDMGQNRFDPVEQYFVVVLMGNLKSFEKSLNHRD